MKQFVLKHRIAITIWAVVVVAGTLLAMMALRPRFTDSDRVFCLSDHEHQREQLVEAAVALGLARRGDTPEQLRVGDKKMTLEQWSSAAEYEKDFQRSCLALNAPRRLNFFEQVLSAESGLVGIVAALIGGGAYYFAERARDRAKRRGDDARRLNDLGTAFVATVENYVRQRGAAIPPERFDVDQIRTHRNELVSELQLVRARHRGWTAPDAPLATLRGILSDRLTGDWRDRNQRADELMAALEQFAEQIGAIAVELERGRPQSTAASR